MKHHNIPEQDAEVAITTRHEQDYISLTDMVNSFEGRSSLIEEWQGRIRTPCFSRAYGNRSTTQLSIPPNSRELETRPAETASTWSSRMPQVRRQAHHADRDACTVRLVGHWGNARAMTSKNKLLTILSDAEQFSLCGLPDFADSQTRRQGLRGSYQPKG
jgi:hypothetical protein